MDVTPRTFVKVGLMAVGFILLLKWAAGPIPALKTVSDRI